VDVAGIQTLARWVALLDGGDNVPNAGQGIAVSAVIPIQNEAVDEAVLPVRTSIVWQARKELELGLEALRLGEPLFIH
jgi:hypothetical protein